MRGVPPSLQLSSPHDLLEDQERYMEEVKMIVIVRDPAPEENEQESKAKKKIRMMPCMVYTLEVRGVRVVTRP